MSNPSQIIGSVILGAALILLGCIAGCSIREAHYRFHQAPKIEKTVFVSDAYWYCKKCQRVFRSNKGKCPNCKSVDCLPAGLKPKPGKEV